MNASAADFESLLRQALAPLGAQIVRVAELGIYARPFAPAALDGAAQG